MKRHSSKGLKKKAKRGSVKYAGLDPRVNRRNIREFLDFDYLDKLTEEEKAFLDDFSKGHYSADFRETKIFKDEAVRRKIYKTNNDRNADLVSFKKSMNDVVPIVELAIEATFDSQDALNYVLDLGLKDFKNRKNKRRNTSGGN